MTSAAQAFHPRNALTYTGLLLGFGAAWASLLGHIGAAGALARAQNGHHQRRRRD